MNEDRHFSFLDAKALENLFRKMIPFDDNLTLKPTDELKTILAANANFPMDLELAAFMEAAARNGGSPMIIQFSSGALETAGKGLSEKPLTRVERLRLGARLVREISFIHGMASESPLVALALDHFSVPPYEEGSHKAGEDEDSEGALSSGRPEEEAALPISPDTAKEYIEKARKAASEHGVNEPSPGDLKSYQDYLLAPEYREAVEGFIAVIREMKPAWAMIDTGEIPAILNFAVTKEVSDLVKEKGLDVMIEAEYGATGQSGEEEEYGRLTGKELQAFARQVAGFVKYTGARGISYPIGMEHAALADEKHEPDVDRLLAVQREIIQVTGRYVPFAQHGGTGAKRVSRGLVGKDNVNTFFLVEAAKRFLSHALSSKEAIEAGKKSACGSNVYLSLSKTVMEAALKKLEECGTLGYAKMLV